MNVQWNQTLLHKMHKDGFSFHNLPGIVHQTLGGAISSGSEGGSRRSFEKQIIGLRLVDGLGNLRTVWRNSTTVQGRREFRAVILSMGLAGVITSVIIKPCPTYCTKSGFNLKPIKYEFTDNKYQRENLLDSFVKEMELTLTESDFSRYLLIPSTRPYQKTLAYCGTSMTEEQFFQDEDNFWVPSYVQWGSSLLGNIVSQPECMRNPAVLMGLFKQRSELYRNFQKSTREDKQVQIGLERCLGEMSKVNQKATLEKGIDYSFYGACLFATLVPPHLVIGVNTQTVYAPAHFLVPVDQVIDLGWLNMELQELYFPITDNSSIEKVLTILVQEFMNNPKDYPIGKVITEVYMGPSSDALMSPSRNKTSLRLSILSIKRTKDAYANVFRKFWSLFQRNNMNFTVHWGKQLPIRKEDLSVWCMVKSHYVSGLQDFKAVVEEFDPLGVFRNAYWTHVIWHDEYCLDYTITNKIIH